MSIFFHCRTIGADINATALLLSCSISPNPPGWKKKLLPVLSGLLHHAPLYSLCSTILCRGITSSTPQLPRDPIPSFCPLPLFTTLLSQNIIRACVVLRIVLCVISCVYIVLACGSSRFTPDLYPRIVVVNA